MAKINKEEYEILKEAQKEGYQLLGRNRNDNVLRAYTNDLKSEKKIKNIRHIREDGTSTLTKFFGFITKEDSEYYTITELVEEYEIGQHIKESVELGEQAMRDHARKKVRKESDETEVKTSESIREEIWEEMLRLEDKRKDQWADIKYQTLREVLQKLGHLDDSEVLSQEFINEKAVEVYADTADAEVHAVFRMRDLQDLLVPKQEGITHKKVEKYLLDRNIRVIDIDVYEKMQSDLAEFENKIVIEKPVIPQFVADYIKWFKTDFEYNFAADIDFIISLIQVSHKFSRREKIKNWISKSGNAQKLIDAYRWGCEVEEEQKYYVKDNKRNTLLRKVIKGFGIDDRKGKIVSSTKAGEASDARLTEQEIKDYDPRYMTFAKPIEELEE